MAELFSRPTFGGFGPNELGLQPHSEYTMIHGNRSAQLRSLLRSECPRRPGVYGMVDQTGELIYVGKAKSLRSRLQSYFRPKSRDPKAGHILKHSVAIAWEHAPSEFAALLRELDLIHRWRPRFNVAGQPHRRKQILICLGRRPAPYLFLASKLSKRVEASYGPVSATLTAREAVRRLNDWFQLRDCPQSQEMVFSDQADLFPMVRSPGCLRYDIGNCTAPCAALCSKDGYEKNVHAARRFLEGLDIGLLATLEREMEQASVSLQFERAASLRDQLECLQWLHERLDRLRQLRSHSFVYQVSGYEGDDRWYLIHHGQIRAVIPVPDTVEDKQRARKMVEDIFANKPGRLGDLLRENRERALLLEGWFRRHSDERERTMTPEKALSILD